MLYSGKHFFSIFTKALGQRDALRLGFQLTRFPSQTEDHAFIFLSAYSQSRSLLFFQNDRAVILNLHWGRL
ncbi:MAG: hypothetical protein GVY17_04865 [Cyanobacteria bacterium]|nr:hypothetical protein [Cyanobacteria bacterium GSL.Bin21]